MMRCRVVCAHVTWTALQVKVTARLLGPTRHLDWGRPLTSAGGGNQLFSPSCRQRVITETDGAVPGGVALSVTLIAKRA